MNDGSSIVFAVLMYCLFVSGFKVACNDMVKSGNFGHQVTSDIR